MNVSQITCLATLAGTLIGPMAVVIALLGLSATTTASGASAVIGNKIATVYEWTDREIISDAPSIVRLDDGKLICTCPLWSRDDTVKRLYGENSCVVLMSDDNGLIWQEVTRVPFMAGKLLLRDNTLHFMGSSPGRKAFQIISSTNGGRDWSAPTVLRKGGAYAASTGWVIHQDKLYWAIDDFGRPSRNRQIIALSASLKSNLMQSSTWRFSGPIKHPGIPQSFGQGRHDGGVWLEPNVIRHHGKLNVIVRVRVSGKDSDAKVPNVAAICTLNDHEDRLDLQFSHYYPVPGAQNQFHIVHDPKSDLFWMTSNAVTGEATDSWRGWGKERRFLMLHYARDGLNWFTAGCAAMWRMETQAFNYASLLIDGDDLLFVSRTAEHAHNQHDNDKVTFHRIPDFRSRALDLTPAR
jgi:hypothetical protein